MPQTRTLKPEADLRPIVAPNVAAPTSPRTLHETGLSEALLADLLLKVLSLKTSALGAELSNEVCLPFNILEPILVNLKDRQLIEVVCGDLMGPVSYHFTLTDLGRRRAEEVRKDTCYVGPAPVPLEQYARQAMLQSARGVACTARNLGDSLDGLVLSERLIEDLGPAIVSGLSILLHGPPGTGKTSVARAIGEFLNRFGGSIWIPHAIWVEEGIVTLFDPMVHEPVLGEAFSADPIESSFIAEEFDHRWIQIRRPTIVVGGELTLEMLDLRFSAANNFYQAPLHLKANGGVFMIDDFGRQIVTPRSLLNRWIVPLEERIDYLTLATGKKIGVPFEELIVFSTNLEPEELADEAFLRRIRYKILIDRPARSTYAQIFENKCHQLGMTYKSQFVDLLYDEYYGETIPPKSSDPRDLLEAVEAICKFKEIEATLEEALLRRAADRFFGCQA